MQWELPELDFSALPATSKKNCRTHEVRHATKTGGAATYRGSALPELTAAALAGCLADYVSLVPRYTARESKLSLHRNHRIDTASTPLVDQSCSSGWSRQYDHKQRCTSNAFSVEGGNFYSAKVHFRRGGCKCQQRPFAALTSILVLACPHPT